MNVTNAYGQQDIWGVLETRHAQSGAGQPRQASVSGGDTVSISPEALELAKAAQEATATAQVKDAPKPAALKETTLEGVAANEEQSDNLIVDMLAPTASEILGKLSPSQAALNPEKIDEYMRRLRAAQEALDRGEISNEELTKRMQGWMKEFGASSPILNPEAFEYMRDLFLTYSSVMLDMGLGVSAPGEKQRDVSPEEARAIEEEVIRRLKGDERTNSLMQQLGIQA